MDRTDRSPADVFLPRDVFGGLRCFPPTTASLHLVVNELRLPFWPRLACLRNPAFSAVDCLRLQSALGRLGPDGVPSYTTDPFVGSQPASVRSVLTSSRRVWTPGKLGIRLTRWVAGTRIAGHSPMGLEALLLCGPCPRRRIRVVICRSLR